MQNKDLTIIFLTANEHPESFAAYHKKILLAAVGDYTLITSSLKPLDFGTNIIQAEPPSHLAMYRQLLKAAKMATTPFVATAESDTLYPREHFSFYRPPANAVAYDMSHWQLFTWMPDYFSLKDRFNNCSLIAPREYLIECLEERFSKGGEDIYAGEIGRTYLEKSHGLTPRNSVEVWCHVPTIQINHPNGIAYGNAHHPTRKRPGPIKAIEIPFWGSSRDIAREYT